ncbi:NACHT domain-containing protein [Nonomuraea wenchangensis]|uniref:NACHT domain-containing protein n=1 Tax=Nonomuraea wenchangensis TaxID=568860 RepID=UPI0037163FAC
MTQDFLDQIAWILSAVAAVAAVIGLRFDAYSHAQGREEAFRKISGRSFAAVGLLLVGLDVFAWLRSAGIPPRLWPDVTSIVTAGVGCTVLVLGIVRVVRTGPEPYVTQLRHISNTAIGKLGEPNQLTEPLVTIGKRVPRRRLASRQLLRSRAKVTFVVGEAGSGKTLALRKALWRTHQHVTTTKKPPWMAVYINLANVTAPITAEAIRSHVYEFVADGDSVIQTDLRNLLDGRRNLRWLFLFDAFHAADSDETTLKAIRQFADSRPAFAAIVVTQDEPDVLAGEKVLRLSPLTYRQQQDIAADSGITDTLLKRLLTHLTQHPEMARRAANPRFLQFLCDHMRQAEANWFPSSSYELLEAVVAQRLRRAANPSQIAEVAESLAARVIDRGLAADLERPDPAAIDALIAVGILQAYRNDMAVFASGMFCDYFAARWLVRMRERIDPQELITAPAWRDPLALCLGPSTGELREPLVTAARKVLDEQLTKAAWAIGDVTPYLTAAPNAPLTGIARPDLAWPAPVRHVLDLLNKVEGDVPASAELTRLIDRIVVSAFVRGRPAEQKRAMALLPLASPEVGAWAVTWLVRTDSPEELTLDAAEQLNASPETFSRLPGHVRLLLLTWVLKSPPLVSLLVPRARIRLEDRVIGLAVLARAAVRLLQAWAVIGIIRFSSLLFGDVSLRWPSAVMPLMCGVFLLGSGPRLKAVSRRAYAMAWFPALLGGLLTLDAVVQAAQAFVFLLSGEIGNGLLELFRATANSWPVALVAFMGWTGRLPQGPRDWILPHLRPLHDLFTQYIAARDPDEIVHAIRRNLTLPNKALLLRWLNGGLFLALAILVFGLPVEIPNVSPGEQTDARAATATGLILLAFLVNSILSKWQQRIKWQGISERMASGHLTAEELLAMLYSAGRADHPGSSVSRVRKWETPETDFLVRALTECPPNSLTHVVDVLRDLDAALGHIAYMVDKNSTEPIPQGVWDSVPQLRHPGLRSSLIQHDKRCPGQLERLAAAHQDRIRRVIERVPES